MNVEHPVKLVRKREGEERKREIDLAALQFGLRMGDKRNAHSMFEMKLESSSHEGRVFGNKSAGT